jgi:hypothetical protein
MPRQRGQQDTIPIAQIRPMHLAAQHSDLMPQREELDFLGPVTTPDQVRLGAGPFPYWAPLDRPYTLVVDEQADPTPVAPFRADGTALLAPVTCAPARPAAAQAGQPGAVAG